MSDDYKRLYRSVDDARLAGVCGGLGNYFKIDPVVIRLLWIVVTLASGLVPGVVAYIAAWIVVPPVPVARPVAPPVARPDESHA